MKKISILIFFIFAMLLYSDELILSKVINNNIHFSECIPIRENNLKSYFRVGPLKNYIAEIDLVKYTDRDIIKFNSYYGDYKDKIFIGMNDNGKYTIFLYDYETETKTKTNIFDKLKFLNVYNDYQYYQNDQLIFANLNGDGSYFDGFFLYLYDINSKELKTLTEDEHGWGLLDISGDKMHLLLDRGNKITVYNIETGKETVLKGADIKDFYKHQWFISNRLIYFEDGTIFNINGDNLANYKFKTTIQLKNNIVYYNDSDIIFFNKLNNGIISYFNNDKNLYMNAIVDTYNFRLSLEEKGLLFIECKGKITAQKANIYENPNLAAPVIANITGENKVDVVDESGIQTTIDKTTDYWYKIKTKDNITGWIFGGYILLDKKATPQATEPVVTSLTASSYNTYKNMYTPLKAFDGDINTAWLEAAKGPGIGETITLELDREITIDSIQVLPGYFDAKWWKSNNRVKSLIMKTDDSTTTLQFQDAMKPHKADFKEPKTFKKVEFIIKEVYPSGKDDDTAISEIQFYYKGERIQLDFSKQEVVWKKP